MFISCGFIHYLVCRSGPLDTLMMFTITISVNSIYNTRRVVMVPIIWLYTKVVVASSQTPSPVIHQPSFNPVHSTHAYLPVKIEQCVPKRRHINFRRRGITQKKAYNI
jgi:hypothetical protein